MNLLCFYLRVVELEQHVCRREEEFTQARREADSIIQQLRYSLSTAEDTVVRERGEHATTKYVNIQSIFISTSHLDLLYGFPIY